MSKDEEKQPASLDSVMRQLDALKQTAKVESTPNVPTGDAARGAIDFASASAVGCVLGYGLDYWQGTSPWGLLGGLFIGVAAGLKMLLTLEAREAKKRAANETTTPKE
jgi:F0F1-type ATP synthase assembly protein I